MLKEKFSYINDERFIFTGRVNDIREFFNKSVVYIAPFKLGGGTKLKILEASSMELPVVATTAGARGIDLKNNESIFVAKNEKEFADNILKLLDDKELCSRVGKSARKIMEEKYDWNIIADNISSVMKNFKR